MQDVDRMKSRYAQLIEDGRKIEVFTSMPEYQWYVEKIIKPTIEEYTAKVMRGEITTDKEDWIIRGMVMGLSLMIETPNNFRVNAEDAKKKAKELEKFLRDDRTNEY